MASMLVATKQYPKKPKLSSNQPKVASLPGIPETQVKVSQRYH